MAMASSSSPKVFSPSNKQKCKEAVALLGREKIISLDSEGVQLGKDGPLTLLQIGTLDGTVYLFDVLINENTQDKTFFRDTGLDRILTSTDIVKVIQSCSGDSAALYHQFGIRLENVFDTQVAHLVIQEHKGRRHPSRVKLAEICKLYSDNANVYEGKEEVQIEWNKHVGNFWAKRPLTQDMIGYASGDVTALIPEVYETQKRYIEDNDLHDIFVERVQDEIEYEIDPDAKGRRKERNLLIRNEIVKDMAKKYRRGTDFASITDEDEIKALNELNTKEAIGQFLRSVEEQLGSPETFNPDRGHLYKLNDIQNCGSDRLQREAIRIKRKFVDVVTSDIQRKYRVDTPLENISAPEYQIIRGLKPLSDDEPDYPPVVMALHWKITQREIKEATRNLASDPDYNMTVPVPKLKFLTGNPRVPADVKDSAQTLLQKYESVILARIPRKYDMYTTTSELTDGEKSVVERIGVASGGYNQVVLSLHWKLAYEKLTSDLGDYRNGKLIVNDGFRRKLEFYKNNQSVPDHVKQKAVEFLKMLPQSSKSNRGRGRRY